MSPILDPTSPGSPNILSGDEREERENAIITRRRDETEKRKRSGEEDDEDMGRINGCSTLTGRKRPRNVQDVGANTTNSGEYNIMLQII